jgi:hypothetical protein
VRTEVDPTPWVDEEAIAEARTGITPLRPTVLPDGVEMQDVYPFTADEQGEFGDPPCAHLNLVYGPPLPPAEALDDPEPIAGTYQDTDGYLDIYLVPADCALQADPTSFAPGRFGDVPTRDVHGITEVLVGDTVAQIDTSYSAELPAMVASIQPFDLDAELARLAADAEAMWSGAP